jgi:hypothetical protein
MGFTTLGFAPLIPDLTAMREPFNFAANSLGHNAAEITADAILLAMDAEFDCDGVPWEPLSYTYAQEKAILAPGEPMSVLYGHMKTKDQMMGDIIVMPKTMTQTYGQDPLAKEEAEKFQEGGAVTGTRQPKRSFYGFNFHALRKLADFFDSIW